MNELMNNEFSMNHVELCELINKLRTEEGNRKQVRTCDFMTKIRKEVETLKSLGLNNEVYFISSTYKDAKGEMRPTFLIGIKGLEWLRDNSIHDVRAYQYAIQLLNPEYKIEYINIAPTNTRKELLIYQILLAWFNEEQIKTQYKVLDYRLDYYIPDCYLVIEFDESTGHKNIEKDNKRMDEVVNYLFKNEYANNKYVDPDEVEKYKDRPYDVITVIRIKEYEEHKGLNELFEFLTGDVKYYSKLINLTR